MSKKSIRVFITLLAVVLCMAAFSTVAYAGGGPEAEPTPAPTATPDPAPTVEPGTPFSEDGNLVVRDLLYDKHTNKQFITVETRNGKIFYIVIDYDKPVDEELEQYHTYFLNMVDERDLLDIIKEEDLPNDSAPVVTPEPSPAPSPEPSPSPAAQEPGAQNNTGGIVAVLLIVAVIAVGVFCFFKFRKPKQIGRASCRERV
jgi:flagellar basal body-associated protein FliL